MGRVMASVAVGRKKLGTLSTRKTQRRVAQGGRGFSARGEQKGGGAAQTTRKAQGRSGGRGVDSRGADDPH